MGARLSIGDLILVTQMLYDTRGEFIQPGRICKVVKLFGATATCLALRKNYESLEDLTTRRVSVALFWNTYWRPISTLELLAMEAE